MGKYNIEFKPSVWKDLDRVPKADRLRILKRVDQLADDPRSFGSEKLSGHKDRYRIRQGNYRILYSIEDDRLIVVVVKVGHRREVYDR
jgi:mRNA interferase RelE/StbE